VVGDGVVVIATLVSLLLSRTKPEPIDDPDDPDRARAEDEAVPMMMG
jgi:hypothetical protein